MTRARTLRHRQARTRGANRVESTSGVGRREILEQPMEVESAAAACASAAHAQPISRARNPNES